MKLPQTSISPQDKRFHRTKEHPYECQLEIVFGHTVQILKAKNDGSLAYLLCTPNDFGHCQIIRTMKKLLEILATGQWQYHTIGMAVDATKLGHDYPTEDIHYEPVYHTGYFLL